MRNRRRVGVYGGTFDPPHVGHILAGQEAQHLYGLDRVLYVCSGDPYQKVHRNVTPAEIRWEMLVEALEPHWAWARASRIELDREGPSYTIETLQELHQPGEDLFLIVGDDVRWKTWKSWDKLVGYATICEMRRWLNVSSTMIRDRVRRGLPVVPLIHPEVYELILNYDLYSGPECECVA